MTPNDDELDDVRGHLSNAAASLARHMDGPMDPAVAAKLMGLSRLLVEAVERLAAIGRAELYESSRRLAGGSLRRDGGHEAAVA